MEKKKVYSLLFLTFVVFSFILINTCLVSAQGFWTRWKEGAVDNADAKILIFLLVAIVLIVLLSAIGLGTGLSILASIFLAFILTAFVTPESVLGIFKSYDAVPLTIATILPLLIFFGLTYISVAKTDRTLMTLQIVAWLVFFLYLIFKLVLYFVFVMGFWKDVPIISSLVWSTAAGETGFSFPEYGTAQGSYFLWALIIQAIIAGLMSFKNGFFMNWAIKMTAGVSKNKANMTAQDLDTAVDFLKKVKTTATR